MANLVVDGEGHYDEADRNIRDGERHDEKIGGRAQLTLE